MPIFSAIWIDAAFSGGIKPLDHPAAFRTAMLLLLVFGTNDKSYAMPAIFLNCRWQVEQLQGNDDGIAVHRDITELDTAFKPVVGGEPSIAVPQHEYRRG